MDFPADIIEFLTDSEGIGFPILIGAGLGIILLMMNFTSKEQRSSDTEIERKKDMYQGRHLPRKPF